MDSNTFFDNFETIANAPGGISRLRELILDLAVNGKLVPQTGEWQECLLGEIAQIRTGKLDANASSSDGRYPFFTCAKDPLRIDSFTYDTECVLLAGNGNFDVNYYSGKFDAYQRTYIIEAQDEKQLFIPFLFRFMQGHSQKLLDQAIGGVIRYIKIGFLTQAQFLLPSLEEQKRIVTKVDELMALCDELEAVQKQRTSIRTAARKSAIDAISTATTPDELNAAWKRISDNWLTIADTSESIASLRSMILSLAVRGKLVDQRMPEGVGLEFVSEFSGSFEPLRVPKTVPFEIPETWVWSYFGNVSINRDYERIPISKPERETRQGPYDYYGASGVIDSYDEFLFDKPLLLIGEDGANLVNRSTPIAFMARGKYWVNNHAHVIDSTSEHALEYLAIVINQMDLKPFLTGTAQPKLNQAKLNGLQIPVPPLDEQKRIVAKVEELMALCGELERSVDERNELSKKISGSLVSETAA